MKAISDPNNALTQGLADIRAQYKVPEAFPPEVIAAAERAAKRVPSAHVDRTNMPFVTLDPATSTDLDQAFSLERSGADLLLHYAIADVNWFVEGEDAIDAEAWRRGTTQYLPDGKASLYPPILSEGAASLLPGGPRPAVIFMVRVDQDGAVSLQGAERAMIRSRAKLAYDSVRDEDLPEGFAELAARIEAAEDRRGAARVDPPEQEVAAVGAGQFELLYRPRLASEARNAAMSLATNMAVADSLQAHHTGLFRVMAEPDAGAVLRLRHIARGLGLDWADTASLKEYEKGLDGSEPKQAAFMLAVRRAGEGASYVPYRAGIIPWHAAMAATYAHATAPLRRLADRYTVAAALAVANGQAVPEGVSQAFPKLPPVMAAAGQRGGQIERAVIDLAEAVMLQGRVGETFAAVATEVTEKAVKIQLSDLPVMASMIAPGTVPGDLFKVRLSAVNLALRQVLFERAS